MGIFTTALKNKKIQSNSHYSHTNSYNDAMTLISQDDHLTAGTWAACDRNTIEKNTKRKQRKTLWVGDDLKL